LDDLSDFWDVKKGGLVVTDVSGRPLGYILMGQTVQVQAVQHR